MQRDLCIPISEIAFVQNQMHPPRIHTLQDSMNVFQAELTKSFNTLMQEGARPASIMFESTFYQPEEDVNVHPLEKLERKNSMLQSAISRWRGFCEWQRDGRESSESFVELQKQVRTIRKERGFLDKAVLTFDAEEQTKLDE